MRTTTAFAVWLALSTSTPVAGAQEASLEALLADAEAENPRLAGARRLAEAAAARVPQAGAPPDPEVGVGLMNVPVRDPGLGNDMMTMAQLQVAARLPWPGKLRLAEEVAGHRAEMARWELERVRLEIRAEVKAAYYEIHFLDRALDVTAHNQDLLSDMVRLTSSRYSVGSGAQPDVLKAQVERSRLSEQRVALEAERTQAVARLNGLLDRPAHVPVGNAVLPAEVTAAAHADRASEVRFTAEALAGVLPETNDTGFLDVAGLQALALRHNPSVQAHARSIDAQLAALALTRTAKRPDVSVTAGYSQRPGLGDFFSVMIMAPVPVFSKRKQDQGVVEQEAVLEEHRARYRATVNELLVEIASLHARLLRARSQLTLLREAILPQARGVVLSATTAYRVGRVDFLALLDAQVTLYRHELEQHRLLADFAENLAALERAVGTEVLR